MQARINQSGLLEVLRRGGWRLQECPFKDDTYYCSHWCPGLIEDDNGHVTVCFGNTFDLVDDLRNIEEDTQ